MNSSFQINQSLLTLSAEQLNALKPYIWSMVGVCLSIIASVIRFTNPKWIVLILTVATAIVSGFASCSLLDLPSLQLFGGMMISDPFSNFFNILFLATAALTALSSFRYLDKEGLQHPEYNVLILFSAIGMMLLASALDFVIIFIALEIMSLSIYSLVGFRRADRKSNEAAMKYFIMGGAASAVYLYGVALAYGVVGSTRLTDLLTTLTSQQAEGSAVLAIGSWLIVVGFLFKIASVPFHMWMPDVYEGAPVPVTGFMTTGLKAAAFATFLRVLNHFGFGKMGTNFILRDLHHVLFICAVATMILGNVIALTQTSLKRMLAYSSIAHTGYLLVGIIAAIKQPSAFSAVVFYLVSYSIMNLGAFVVLTVIAKKGDSGLQLQDLNGLSKRHPWLAFALACFLFSMAGVPPAAGFVGKYMLFYSAIQAGEVALVTIAVLCSAVSVYYYLRVMVMMYMREPEATDGLTPLPFFSKLVIVAMVVLTLQVGILPRQAVEWAKRSVASLIG